MSQPNTVNPYVAVGLELPSGLNSIIAFLPASPTVDNLVDAVIAFVQPLYYPGATAATIVELKSVAYNVVNSYRSNLVLSGNAMFNPNQAPFVQMLIGGGMTANTSPDSVADRIADIEDNIGTSELTVPEQTPLFLATTLGSQAYTYWVAQLAIAPPPPSAWAGYFSSNAGQNYMNTLQWTVAAMNGALAGYGAAPAGLVAPTVNMVTTNMASALIGALTATAGKIIFNWIPRITKPIQLNMQRIGSLNNGIVPVQPNATANCMFNSRLFCGSNHCGKSVGGGMFLCAFHGQVQVFTWFWDKQSDHCSELCSQDC